MASRALRPAALQVRGLAGSVKIQETALDDVIAPFEVERTEPLHEMGVLYPPGVPSPMESVLSDPPIVVDGLIAKTGAPEKATAPRPRAPEALTLSRGVARAGGGPTGHPIEYIKLSGWCAVCPAFPSALSPSPGHPPPPNLWLLRPQGPDARGVQVLGDAVREQGGSRLRGEQGGRDAS